MIMLTKRRRVHNANIAPLWKTEVGEKGDEQAVYLEARGSRLGIVSRMSAKWSSLGIYRSWAAGHGWQQSLLD